MGTLRSMRLDSMAALGVGPEGQPINFYAGYLGEPDEGGTRQVLLYGPLRPNKLPQIAPVSYTHLDVYKRQLHCIARHGV